MSCIPPWMTDDVNTWCNGSMQLNEDKQENVQHLMGRILEGATSCPKPCKDTNFETKV